MGNLRPNLTALRALLLTSHLKSYTLTAKELHLTHSAVSHQIRQLEGMLGVTLFTRIGSQMQPTPVCYQLADKLHHIFSAIDTALDEVKQSHERGTCLLQISTMADFANAWLIPLLSDFTREQPMIDLALTIHSQISPPNPYSFDVGIWHQRIDEPGFRSTRLINDKVIAVCSKKLTIDHAMLNVSDLINLPLLRYSLRSWKEFFIAAGVNFEEPKRGLIYGDASSLLSAALAGQGAALIRKQLAKNYINSGELIQVGCIEIDANLDYYFSWREGNQQESSIIKFYEWISKKLNKDILEDIRANVVIPRTAIEYPS